MVRLLKTFKSFVAMILVTVFCAGPGFAQTETLDELFVELKNADETQWRSIERKIWTEWSRSGSPAMDLLLQRGRAAMEAGDYTRAIEHFTALTDHAPDFAEGWNARATAYYNVGLYGPSIEDIGRVLTLNPRHFGAMSGLAQILEELGHPEDALEAYRQVQSIHPHRANLQEAIERLEEETSGTDL